MSPDQTEQPLTPLTELQHRINLFNEALTGPASNAQRLEHTVMWLGELKEKGKEALNLLLPLMDATVAPLGSWAVKARAACSLIEIDEAQFGERARTVLFDLVTSSDYGKHLAAVRMLQIPGIVTTSLMDRCIAASSLDATPAHFKNWFNEIRWNLLPLTSDRPTGTI